MAATIIYYEQPLNELVRACLRLEYLCQITKHNISNPSAWASHTALEAIVDTINILDRPDLKTKFLVEFRRFETYYQQFQENPKINPGKLSEIMHRLNRAIQLLQPPSGKFAQDLREHPFMAAIRQHLGAPGGTCNADMPLYHHWLHLPPAQRQDYLNTWLSGLEDAYRVSAALLDLARQNVEEQSFTAQEGFYQMPLESTQNKLIARIGITNNLEVYPVVSVGKYRLSVYFFKANFSEKPEQSLENIPFVMAY